jgi:hypothetical protein
MSGDLARLPFIVPHIQSGPLNRVLDLRFLESNDGTIALSYPLRHRGGDHGELLSTELMTNA